MIDWFKSYYNKKELSSDMFMFNVIHSICVIGMLIITFVTPFFFEDVRAVYLNFGVCVLFLLTMIEANRTGRVTLPVVFMSVAFNVLFMPSLMFLFGLYVCVIPVYFLFGILYTVLMLDPKRAAFFSIFESLVYLAVLFLSAKTLPVLPKSAGSHEVFVVYGGAFIAVIIVGLCSGAAIRFRFLGYERSFAEAEKLKAEALDAYVAKDMFLINMSHEIRTPMNAIVGTVDLLLDQEVSEHVSDNIYNILNSCNALLSITDELMDLSKSESGEINLYSATYDLNDLLMEVINMMTVRLTESNLDFYVDINKSIPRYLYGDSSKIRQLLSNVLNNAIKFTHFGRISMRVDYKVVNSDSIELIVDVEDTGEGIRKEDIPKLFVRSEKSDSSMETIDGSGMGLAICSEIIKEMNGEISVQSEFNKGSVFTIKIPQKFISMDTVAYIPDANNYKILIFEKNKENYDQVKKTLDSFGIESDQAKNKQDFERLLNVNQYTHVFVSNERYEECESLLNERLISEKIVAFLDIDDNVLINKATSVLTRPIHSLNIAALIKNETNSYVRDITRKGGFKCPQATVLVVDDNYTNLNVASALISKYQANVITAMSGKECLRIIRDTDVDIIFLDYMMPEMDGIDTLENIRKIPGSRYASLPVIALTANVISGAREMFLEAGFDDFMAKPISVDKMERTLKKFLPKEYVEYDKLDD